MQNRVDSNTQPRFWRTFLTAQIVIFGLVAVLCWLGNALTIEAYSSSLIVAGLLVIIVDITGLLGSWSVTRDFIYLYGHTVSEKRLNQLIARDLREQSVRFDILFEEVLLGLFPILVGILLKVLLL